ncbi:hypothetical protein GJ496_010603 [Pomphorhynchus laevis]|nr:hypothetical protein GJ496_010603 [Pomphorhynchus laevis]
MEAHELEYIAENEPINIIPKFSGPPIALLSGTVGPFKAGIVIAVPLWLALTMKHQNRAHIVVPDWMNLDNVIRMKNQEYVEEAFAAMPNPYWMVVAKMLLKLTPEDIPNADQVHSLLQDIWDKRQYKFRKSTELFIQGNGGFASLPHCTVPEINLYRDLLASFVSKANELNERQKELG